MLLLVGGKLELEVTHALKMKKESGGRSAAGGGNGGGLTD